MTEENKYRAGLDVIYLASCALNGIKPDASRVLGMDLTAVYKASARHSMQAITCFAIESLLVSDKDFSIDDKLLSEWKDAKNKAVRKLIFFDAEREKIFAFMNNHGIWHMPLKGVVLQKFYPKFGMRQITDNDILFDETFRKELRDYMESMGYECQAGGRTTHDVYKKAPVLNFEMHVSLYSPMVNDSWYDYYKNVKERLVNLGDCLYGFTDEDMYIYIISHNYKHYRFVGNGIRSLMDVYLLNKHLGQNLNREYITTELKKLEADEFEKDTRELSNKIFDPSFDLSELDEKGSEILAVTVLSGAYGTQERAVNTKLEGLKDSEGKVTTKVKMKYLLRNLFPDMEYYRELHPFFYKYRIFIPFFALYRIIRAPFRRWKYIKSVFFVLFGKKK